MSIRAEKITLAAATPTLLASAGSDLNDRKMVLISSPTTALFLGGATVDAAEGFPIAITTGSATLELGPGDNLYGFSTAGCDVNVLTTRSGAAV